MSNWLPYRGWAVPRPMVVTPSMNTIASRRLGVRPDRASIIREAFDITTLAGLHPRHGWLRGRLWGMRGMGMGDPVVNTAITDFSSAAGTIARGGGSTQSIVMSAPSIVGGTTIAIGSAMHATWLAAAVPIIGVAIAGIALALSLWFGRKGPKQKIATTEVVNELEPKLQENVRAYVALPVRYYSAQQQALANFDAVWSQVMARCETDAMGNPGKACVNDRQSGACKWQSSPGGWSADGRTYTAPGPAGSGTACWNWFVGYRDPIANDPGVVPDPGMALTKTGETVLIDQAGNVVPGNGSAGGISPTLLLAVGAVVLALSMGGGGSES